MTKTMGGLKGLEGAGLLVGQLLHWQATQRRPGEQDESGSESPEQRKEDDKKSVLNLGFSLGQNIHPKMVIIELH